MLRSSLGCVVARFGRFAAVATIASSVLVSMVSGAEARRRAKPSYSPPYASIVVDAKTGKVLQATNPDAPRHPASVTKVMTLYMLFEAMERGRFSLDSELKISAHAARQAPSKLGLQPGETISVEDAIKAVVTKSANDIAAAIAENVGGSEERFAELMTDKARAIGMRGTTFVNASGLPDPEQITTARDLALLGRAIQDRFPKYYHFFGTRTFNYDGYAYRNHNRLLGRVEGVDGIKTGYTRASGFNLLTSAKADGRHVITVVLGGRSGRVRDAQVAALVDQHLPRAYAGARTAPRVIEVASNEDDNKPARVEKAAPAPQRVAAAPVVLTARTAGTQPVAAAAVEGRARPAVVTELPPQRPQQVAISPSPRVGQPMALVAGGAVSARPGSAPLALAATQTPQPAMRWNVGAQPVRTGEGRLVPPGSVRYTNGVATTVEADESQPMPGLAFGALMPDAEADAKPDARPAAKPATQQQAAAAPKLVVTPAAEAQRTRSGWVIQIGATDDESKAKGILNKAKSASPKMLSDADAFTEKVEKGGSTLYRARFSGFESGEAEAACKALKRAGFSCFAQRI